MLSIDNLNRVASEICQAYPILQPGFTLHPLGNHGGFSGARLWRVETFAGQYCLRAWPPSESESGYVARVHRLMQLASDAVSFVPRVFEWKKGRTYRIIDGRVWELASWLPGVADFHDHPTRSRLQVAMKALARSHRLWEDSRELGLGGRSTCPAVKRRLKAQAFWLDADFRAVHHAMRDARPSHTREFGLRAWPIFADLIRRMPHHLVRSQRRVPLQPCLCDIWHDHVLFTDSCVTGIVDYASIKLDNVAVDLARLLGSFVGDDKPMRETGLAAYEAIRPLSKPERELVDLLDWTGVVVGVGNWLRWLFIDKRQFEDMNAVVKRLSQLVTRMESWRENEHAAQASFGA